MGLDPSLYSLFGFLGGARSNPVNRLADNINLRLFKVIGASARVRETKASGFVPENSGFLAQSRLVDTFHPSDRAESVSHTRWG